LEKAFSLYVLASKKGLPEAIYNLSYCYEYGIGIDEEPDKAVQFLAQAATAGSSRALYSLGEHYEEGLLGLKRDLRKAFEYYVQ